MGSKTLIRRVKCRYERFIFHDHQAMATRFCQALSAGVDALCDAIKADGHAVAI